MRLATSPCLARAAWRPLARLVFLLTFAVPSVLQAADSLRVVPVSRDGHVLVSCELPDGYTDEIREIVQSGLETTISYSVELRLGVPGWVDRTIASAVVTATVDYDNLTRRHSVSRIVDGRVEEARVLEDEAQVRQWLTTFDRLPLFRTSRLQPNREYYVVVRAKARPYAGPIPWPFDSAPAGSAKFTFIP
jgi:hypothetical protein